MPDQSRAERVDGTPIETAPPVEGSDEDEAAHPDVEFRPMAAADLALGLFRQRIPVSVQETDQRGTVGRPGEDQSRLGVGVHLERDARFHDASSHRRRESAPRESASP
jgi:hypothetical protein